MTPPSIELGQLGFIRRFKGAALSILLALYASARSLGVKDLVAATGWSRAQIRRALGQLQAQGWVERHARYHGWALVDQVRQSLRLWLHGGEQDASSALPAPSRRLEVVNSINNTTSRDSDSAARQQNEALPPVERILRATDVLFGEPVWGPPQRYGDPQLLLAWIARAYQLRARLDKPARVVFRNLQSRRPPPQRFLDNPLIYLPHRFLEAAGFPVPAGGSCGLDEGGEEAFPLQAGGPPPASLDPSLDYPARPAVGDGCAALSAAQAWQQALDLLRPCHPGGMPASAYAGWVAPAVLLRYEPPPSPGDPAVFAVLVPTDFLRAVWLDRLVPALCRQLAGICAGEVSIQVHTQGEPENSYVPLSLGQDCGNN
jgi:IclR helix-turn-helix domain